MLDEFDKDTRNLESNLRAEVMRVEVKFADHAARGARGKIPEADIAKAKALHAQLNKRRQHRAKAMRATRADRTECKRRARDHQRHEAKIACLEKRGPHLRYLIAYYQRPDVNEPDMVARYEAELVELPGHLAALRQRRQGFEQAKRAADQRYAKRLQAELKGGRRA